MRPLDHEPLRSGSTGTESHSQIVAKMRKIKGWAIDAFRKIANLEHHLAGPSLREQRRPQVHNLGSTPKAVHQASSIVPDRCEPAASTAVGCRCWLRSDSAMVARLGPRLRRR